MTFPTDLTNVNAFKIHPAIGLARLANNPDFYEFFDYEKQRTAGQAQALKFMSVYNGRHVMMRQAVRFKIFAYGSDGAELGELTQEAMTALGIVSTWTANVANRKLNTWSNGATPVVAAQASATGADTGRLDGANPWAADKVWLGDIRGDGLFIPPTGGVYRKDANKTIPDYSGHARDNGVLDTTCDGSISVALTNVGARPIIPACVIVAPQDHSPDVGPGQIDNFTNKDFVRETRALLGIAADSALSGLGYAMDLAMMKTMNAQYDPGMEICLAASRALPNPASAFYPRGINHIDAKEIRPSYGPGGASPGQLTGGLCSTWQSDLSACLDYWTSTYPDSIQYPAAPQTRELARKVYSAAGPRMNNPEDLNAYIDMMEVGRDANSDPFNLVGTERDPGEDVGDTPAAPFPLKPWVTNA